MNIGRFILQILVAFCATTLLAQAQDRLVLLDGSVVEATLKSIDDEGRLTGEGLTVDLIVDGLRRIETPIEVRPFEAATSVEMLGGGVIGAEKFSVDEQQRCHINNSVIGDFAIPIDALRSVRFVGGAPQQSFVDAAREKSDEDQVFVKLGGGLEPINGLIETVDDFNVVIDPGNGPRKLPREKVYGIVFALVGRAPDHTGEALITLADGSTSWGKIKALDDGQLTLRTVGDVDLPLPWEKVGRLQVRSSRMVFLSDLEPLEARHQPLVTLERPWQADKSVGGRPLTLSGRQYEKGIGVASRSVLVFNNEGNFDLLAASIGIDDETEGRGDCIFVIEVDGREKLRQRVVGKDAARPISVEIDGAQRISLIVEAGEDLDLSDHANWCDVRFVKE